VPKCRACNSNEKCHCGCILCQWCNKLYWEHEEFTCNKYMFQAIKPQSKLLHWYVEQIERRIKLQKPIYLAVVGRDPYPNKPIGIPFAKENMSSQKKCDSGYVLLWALGIHFFPTRIHSVKKLYKVLLENGIVFLNISYKFLGENFSKAHTIHYLKCANLVNKSILDYVHNNNGSVLLLGEDTAKGICWANKEVFHSKMPVSISLYRQSVVQICHPSGVGDATWKKVWGGKQGCLLSVIANNGKRNVVKNAIGSVNAKLPANIGPIPPSK